MDGKPVRWKKNTALFLIGQGVTLFGSMLVHYAIIWHITLQTQSGVMMTLIAISGALPMFFISPFAGVWADRYNKKTVINLADAAIAAITLVMAVLFSLGVEVIGLLLLCLTARGLGQGVQMPAVNALIPEIVPKEHLTRVNGLSGGLQSIVMLASPMAGGALLAVAPIQTLMYIDVVTAAIGISMLVFFVKVPERSRSNEPEAGAKKYFSDIADGLKYIMDKPFLKKMLMLNALFNISFGPFALLAPLQIARNYGDDIWTVFGSISIGAEQRLALLSSMNLGGMIIGGLIISFWGGFKNKSHTMALSAFLIGIGIVGLGLIGNIWLYLLCVGVLGVVMSLFNPPLMATLQTNVDSAYMGRVFSALGMIGSLMMPLGMVVWGPLGDVVDIGWLLIGTGAALFAMGFVFMLDKVLLQAGAPPPSTEGGAESA
ncbi:MAG: MFS transporter [Oscillospiraceae bacterium]|nr:MFS transporter [Oscillospiraceae bacterium]